MRSPRELATTLPSPSEMDNFHRCPCLWVLKDRMWVHSVGDRWPLVYGRMIDTVCGEWLEKKVSTKQAAVERFDALMDAVRPTYEDEYFETFGASTRDALIAWVQTFGEAVRSETILAVQPKILGRAKVKIDYVVQGKTGLRIRERKLLSGFADFEDEITKYEMGFQPICYKEMAEAYFEAPVECVEMEFLVRSVPAKGKYKAKEATARREALYFDDWKPDMWYNTAVFTNAMMQLLEQSLLEAGQTQDEVQFVTLPRFTRNCLVKLGSKTYPCDFHKACRVMMSPLLMPEEFICDRKEAFNGSGGTGDCGVHAECASLAGTAVDSERVSDGDRA